MEVINEFKNYDFKITGSREIKSFSYKTDVNFLTIFRKSLKDTFKKIVSDFNVEKRHENNNFSLIISSKKTLSNMSLNIIDSVPYISSNKNHKVYLKKNIFNSFTTKTGSKDFFNESHINYKDIFIKNRIFEFFAHVNLIINKQNIQESFFNIFASNLNKSIKISSFMQEILNDLNIIKTDLELQKMIYHRISSSIRNGNRRLSAEESLLFNGCGSFFPYLYLKSPDNLPNKNIIDITNYQKKRISGYLSNTIRGFNENTFNYRLRKKLKILTTCRKIALFSFLINEEANVIELDKLVANKVLKKYFMAATVNVFNYEIEAIYVKNIQERINNYLQHIVGKNFSKEYIDFLNKNKHNLSLLKTTSIGMRKLGEIIHLDDSLKSEKLINIIKFYPNFDTLIVNKDFFLNSKYMENIMENDHPHVIKENIKNFYNEHILLNQFKVNESLFKFLKLTKKSLDKFRKMTSEQDMQLLNYGYNLKYNQELDLRLILCFYNNSNYNLFLKMGEHFKLTQYQKKKNSEYYRTHVLAKLSEQYNAFHLMNNICILLNFSNIEKIIYLRSLFQTDKSHLFDLIKTLLIELLNMVELKDELERTNILNLDLTPIKNMVLNEKINKNNFQKLHDLIIVECDILKKFRRNNGLTPDEVTKFSDHKIIEEQLLFNDFKINQLTTVKELVAEHKEMKHCINQYYSVNLERNRFLFKINHINPKHKSSIEIAFSLKNGVSINDEIKERDVLLKIVQNQAYGNKTPTEENQEFIKKLFIPFLMKNYKLFVDYKLMLLNNQSNKLKELSSYKLMAM